MDHQQYMGVVVRDPVSGEIEDISAIDEWLYLIGLLYEESCENYDQRVCAYTDKHGIARPLGPVEYGAINHHAKEVRDELMARYGLSCSQFLHCTKLFHQRHRNGMTAALRQRLLEERESNPDAHKIPEIEPDKIRAYFDRMSK